MTHQPSLSWSLIVATYQREKILYQCLALAVRQTRKPKEIIVVDASPHWEDTKKRIYAEIALKYPEIRWIYEVARQASLTRQRNQGIEIATADILFLFDDDSLMYATCAEEIMKVYEASPGESVMGVEAAAATSPPIAISPDEPQKVTGGALQPTFLKNVQNWLWKNIFLMDATHLFIPYQGTFPHHPIPSSISHLRIVPVPIFQGFRMTYRRKIIVQEQFEPLLLYYAAGEDLDASYRVSCHGILLEALDAKVYHFQSASGRLSRYTTSILSASNQAVLIRKYATELKRIQFLYYRLMFRRLFAEILKDLLSRRWSLPQFRGILTALKYTFSIFSLPEDDLEQWYLSFQKELIHLNENN